MLKVNAYSVRRFYRNGIKVYLSTMPSWFNFYKDHRFYELGEFKNALQGNPVFKLWDCWDRNDEDFWKVITPAKNYFNQNHGLCYVKKNKAYVDVLNFGADEEDHKINERYLNEKERIIRFYDFLEVTTINPLTEKAPKFVSKKQNTSIDSFLQEKASNSLSPQEARVISLWSQGYTIKQIALFLNVSPRTV